MARPSPWSTSPQGQQDTWTDTFSNFRSSPRQSLYHWLFEWTKYVVPLHVATKTIICAAVFRQSASPISYAVIDVRKKDEKLWLTASLFAMSNESYSDSELDYDSAHSRFWSISVPRTRGLRCNARWRIASAINHAPTHTSLPETLLLKWQCG